MNSNRVILTGIINAVMPRCARVGRCAVVAAVAVLCGLPQSADAEAFLLEPDEFDSATVLNTVADGVTLSTVLAENVASPFNVTATDDPFDIAPTGSRVFGHQNVGFWNHTRRLMMEFKAPISAVALDFAGGDLIFAETGRLEAYDNNGGIVGEYITSGLNAGEVERMSVISPQADIAKAVAFIAEGDGNFGQLDSLVYFSEPSDRSDFDMDGDVDGRDLLTMLLSAGQCDTNKTRAPFTGGDANLDGTIDRQDLMQWRTHAGISAQLNAASTSIPEPSGCILAAAVALLTLAITRRR